MPGLVHIVDDDASFCTAIERRLKKAGYDVAIYPSAQDLLDRLPSESESACILLDVRIPEARLDVADRVSDRSCGCPDNSARHQGGRGGFPHQADIVRGPYCRSRTGFSAPTGRAWPERRARHGARAYREADAPRTRSVRTRYSRQDQQAGWKNVGRDRAHDQGPSPQGDGEDASPVSRGTGFLRGAGRHTEGSFEQPTDALKFRQQELHSIVPWDNRNRASRRLPKQHDVLMKPRFPDRLADVRSGAEHVAMDEPRIATLQR